MINLLKAEFYKLFLNKSFWIIGLFALLLSSLLLMDSKTYTANLFYASLYNTPLLYFLTIIFCSLFIGKDFEERTLYRYISSGHKRGHVVFAKVICYEIACLLILGIPLFIHGIMGSITQPDIFMELDFVSVFAILLSICTMCMLSFLFAFIFRDLGKTLAVPMVLFFLMIFLLNGDVKHYISLIFPIGQLRLMSLQQLSVPIIVILAINCMEIALLYLGAHCTFVRSELQ